MRAAGGRICGAVTVLALWLMLAPGAASAELEPGVRVDPGSPAAKEYALQLNKARQTGAESSKAGSSGGLFGAGIKPPSSGAGGPSAGAPGATGATTTSARSGARAHAKRGSRSQTASQPTPVALPAAVLRAARAQGSSAGSGSWLALVGGGVAIVLLGGFGGTVLRHNRRPSPSS
jgi:cobalamin biosynthesis Mg chelatase CobN